MRGRHFFLCVHPFDRDFSFHSILEHFFLLFFFFIIIFYFFIFFFTVSYRPLPSFGRTLMKATKGSRQVLVKLHCSAFHIEKKNERTKLCRCVSIVSIRSAVFFLFFFSMDDDRPAIVCATQRRRSDDGTDDAALFFFFFFFFFVFLFIIHRKSGLFLLLFFFFGPL